MNLLKRPLDDSAFRAESKKLRYEKWTEFQIQLETCMEKKCLCEVSLGDIIIHLGKFIRWGGDTVVHRKMWDCFVVTYIDCKHV